MQDVLTKRPLGFLYNGKVPPWEPVEHDDNADYLYESPHTWRAVGAETRPHNTKPPRPRIWQPPLDAYGQWHIVALACKRYDVMTTSREVGFVADMIKQNESKRRPMSIAQAQWLAAIHHRIERK